MSERTYKRLSKIQVLIGEEKYSQALDMLNGLYPSVKHKPYEHALVLQTYGYVYASKEQYKKAIQYFDQAIALNVLPDQARQSALYNLAQLYMATSNFKQTLVVINKWFEGEKEPHARGYAFRGTVYAQLKKNSQAISDLYKAIELSKKPQESWMQLLLALEFERKNFKAAAILLEKMVAFFPEKKDYWKQLSGVYFRLKQDMKALSTMELAYKKDFLQSEAELKNLANMYMYQNIPIKAAMVLEKGIKEGKIEQNEKNLKLLADSQFTAKEYKSATETILEAAKKSQDAELYMRAGMLMMEKSEWKSVIQTVRKAIKAGNLKKPGNAYLISGIAHYELKDYTKAIESLEKSSQFKESSKQAEQWIKYVQTEMARLE